MIFITIVKFFETDSFILPDKFLDRKGEYKYE